MLALHPDRVRRELAQAGATAPIDELMPRLVAGGVRPVSANGVLGDPAGADAAEGRRLLDRAVEELDRAVGAIGARGPAAAGWQARPA